MDELDKIKQILSSQFEIDLLNASIANLNDKSNKLRYNNFAYSIRELSRHFLYSLSPESNVERCIWYKPETEDKRPTRYQRIKYAIQGGISDEILEKWGFDIKELAETIKIVAKTISSLSKYTHINPEVFGISDAKIEEYSKEVLDTFLIFVETINEYKERLKDFLDGHIEEQMISSVVGNFFENVDCIAPHYSLDYSEVSEYQISEITDSEIIVEVTGNIYVTLLYGSSQERREGDGLDIEEHFPFETKVKYEITEDFPTDRYEIEDYDVDTSEWYGDDYIET